MVSRAPCPPPFCKALPVSCRPPPWPPPPPPPAWRPPPCAPSPVDIGRKRGSGGGQEGVRRGSVLSTSALASATAPCSLAAAALCSFACRYRAQEGVRRGVRRGSGGGQEGVRRDSLAASPPSTCPPGPCAPPSLTRSPPPANARDTV
jgi:hypothetical protein